MRDGEGLEDGPLAARFGLELEEEPGLADTGLGNDGDDLA